MSLPGRKRKRRKMLIKPSINDQSLHVGNNARIVSWPNSSFMEGLKKMFLFGFASHESHSLSTA